MNTHVFPAGAPRVLEARGCLSVACIIDLPDGRDVTTEPITPAARVITSSCFLTGREHPKEPLRDGQQRALSSSWVLQQQKRCCRSKGVDRLGPGLLAACLLCSFLIKLQPMGRDYILLCRYPRTCSRQATVLARASDSSCREQDGMKCGLCVLSDSSGGEVGFVAPSSPPC